MGWASGSRLAEDIWDAVRPELHPNKRRTIAKRIIDLFESEDCDTMQECSKLCKDAGVYQDEDED